MIDTFDAYMKSLKKFPTIPRGEEIRLFKQLKTIIEEIKTLVTLNPFSYRELAFFIEQVTPEEFLGKSSKKSKQRTLTKIVEIVKRSPRSPKLKKLVQSLLPLENNVYCYLYYRMNFVSAKVKGKKCYLPDHGCTSQYLTNIKEKVNELEKNYKELSTLVLNPVLKIVPAIALKLTQSKTLAEDLILIGNESLLTAVYFYDLSSGCRLSTFASQIVLRDLKQAMGILGQTVINPKLKEYRQTSEQLRLAYGRPPTMEEVSVAMHTSLDAINTLRVCSIPTLSFSSPAADDSDSTITDNLPDKKFTEFPIECESEVEHILLRLPEENKQILEKTVLGIVPDVLIKDAVKESGRQTTLLVLQLVLDELQKRKPSA